MIGLFRYELGPLGLLAVMVSGLIACERVPADYEQLRAENERLKREVERLTHPFERLDRGSPDLTEVVELSLKELWSQRFEETKLRAKMNLDQKILRVTGNVETVRDRSLALYGNTTRFGRMKMEVQLEDGYAGQVQDGLAALHRGIPVTVQGKFVYESMWLTEATFVESASGKPLSSSDLAALAESAKSADQVEARSSESKVGALEKTAND